jgi:hypothetical protein
MFNFCDNCGADLKEHRGALFCHNCGSPLENELNISSSQSFTDSDRMEFSNKSAFDHGFNSYGIIFTNSNVLIKRLNCREEDVESVLLNYISQIEKFGHQYILLDAGNNSYSNLDADDDWQSHVELLKDFYNDNSQAEYLFVVGGHDVIPMAIIDNEPRCYQEDHEIDTDMPYSYLLISDFEKHLWSGNIFKKDVHLFCGRLPIPYSSNLNFLESYLINSGNVMSRGTDTGYCFGMTAKSWEIASNTIINKIDLNKRLHTSPEHNLNSAKDVFNTRADLYYFNLHGSDSPRSPEFFGDQSAVISPDYLSQAENLNFLVTEACYGAKFIDYESHECMLLTALENRTVAYLGSSKVAFGASTENISSADVVAKSFLENIITGQTCGRALALARIDVFDACPTDHYDYGTTSSVEFNLFGDPLCSIDTPSNKKRLPLVSKIIRSKSFNNTRPEKREIKFDSVEKGLLNDVRNLVNQEIQKIGEIIDHQLYSQFNIEARRLSSIFEIKGKYGEITYNYNYLKDSFFGKSQVYAVFADRSGKIKSIIQSK